LKPEADGAAVVDAAAAALDRDDGGAEGAPVGALYRELADAIRAAAAGRNDSVAWRSLMLGDTAGDTAAAGARRIVVLRPVLDFDRVQPALPAIDALRAIVDELRAEFPDVDASLTGSVAMEHEEMLTVRSGAGLAALASLLMVGIVLYLALRSFKLIAIA